jgi:molybdopterin synthase catalytic subunit
VVRDHDSGHSVTRLEYSAHPTAQQTLADVAAEIAADCTGVRAIAVSHRIGALEIGDAALVAAVAADHRQAAFDTCARLVDSVKARLPVWKHQFFADGADEWVGSA